MTTETLIGLCVGGIAWCIGAWAAYALIYWNREPF